MEDDLEVLRKFCEEEFKMRWAYEVIANSEDYIEQRRLCSELFGRLKKILPAEGIELLAEYEEAVAKQEDIIIEKIVNLK